MISDFGTTAGGDAVQSITLQAGDLTVRLLTWGAVLQSVRLAGVAHDLTLGSDDLAEYQGALMHHGSLIGPVVNRISNARATIGGVDHAFEVNFNDRHTIHSGAAGTHRQNWAIQQADATSCTLALELPPGAGGFPGLRHVAAHFAITAPATLTQTVSVATDAETIVNFANHSYWNLDGAADWSGHALQVAADAFLPNDADFKPTGEVRAVAGTEMDFRQARAITPGKPELDTCFALSRARQPLRDVLWLSGKSGVRMTVATTECGVQVYDQRSAARAGHGVYEGLAIECQGWPDAPSHPDFPSIALKPGDDLQQITQWRFAR